VAVVLKSARELELLEEANRIVLRVLAGIGERIRPGVTTKELDRYAEAEIRRAGAVPAFLGYRGFPASICASVNDVIVHGIPNDRPLEEGDVLGVDCGVRYRGYYGDAARTFPVGAVSPEAQALLQAGEEALKRGVEAAQPHRRVSDIGYAVQSYVEAQGFSVVREFVGHGIGTSLHEEPQVPNFGSPGQGLRLEPGLVLAIEPMIAAGDARVVIDEDGWTARTRDGSLAVHFEYSVAITEKGPRVLGIGA
jgi:methionyl aminopeptidase